MPASQIQWSSKTGDSGNGVANTAVSGVALGARRGSLAINTLRVNLTNVAIATTDATTNGAYGSLELGTLPEGVVDIVCGLSSITSLSAASGIGATATVKYAVGTAAEASNDTLDSTQANIIPSTNVTLTASASTAVANAVSTSRPGFFNGTGTAQKFYLNIGVADAGSTGNSTVTVSGWVELVFIYGGDI